MTIYDKLSSKSYYCRSLKIYAAFSRVPKQLPRTVSSLVVFGEVGEMRISPCFILIIYCKPICCSSMSSFFRSMHFCWKGMRLHCLFSWDLQVVTNTSHALAGWIQKTTNCWTKTSWSLYPISSQSRHNVRLSVPIRPHPPHPQLPQIHSCKSTGIVGSLDEENIWIQALADST